MAYLPQPPAFESFGAAGNLAAALNSSSTPLDLSALDLRLEPGDVLVIALATVTSTSTAVVSANWQER